MTQRWRLDGKRAFVTGGTRGIGAAIARELLSLGATVTITARDAELVESTVKQWQDEGLPAYGCGGDVARHQGRREALHYALERMGGLDILVNNAGTNRRGPSISLTALDSRTVIRTNLTAPWEMCRLAYPHLKASAASGEDACIIGIGSVAGARYIGSGAPYAMTKAAMDVLTRYLAVEWAEDGIRVNGVNPWYTRTPLANAVLDDPAFTERVLKRTPNRRIADPEDISGLVAFLCLPAARHISGQTIAVDGAFLANAGF